MPADFIGAWVNSLGADRVAIAGDLVDGNVRDLSRRVTRWLDLNRCRGIDSI
ncbi:MAG: hypothetical protein IPO43_15450 [Rhodoferax sp.]|nr:hypothetical protein [Rhodoferax sp.]